MIMKYLKKIQLTVITILALSAYGFGQNCTDFHLTGDCKKDFIPFYKMYSQSRSDMLGVGYTVKYNLIFYGEKEYMVSFCTEKDYYPVHFTLSDPVSEEVFYDNKDDEYVESIGFGVEKTRMMLIEVEILGYKASDKQIEDTYSCVGMLIQFKPFE